MIAELCLVLAAQSGPLTAAQQVAAPLAYEDVNRLARTPMLDGKIDAEEWDVLGTSGAAKSWFSWEPHMANIAGQIPTGQDALISLDMQGSGWHIGADNLEIRLKWTGSAVEPTVRRMTDSGPQGPVWLDAADFRAALKTAGTTDAAGWTFELSLEDPSGKFLPENPGARVGVRVDAISAAEAPLEPFVPRMVPLVSTTWDKGQSLQPGLSWKTDIKGRSIMQGQQMKIRYNFSGMDGMNLSRVEMRTEGPAGLKSTTVGVPFPTWDRRFHAFTDYVNPIPEDAPFGWRVARATVTDTKGGSSVLQTCYEVTPPISFDYSPKSYKSSSEQQVIKVDCYIRSNTTLRVNGVFTVVPPSGWEVESGNGKTFSLILARSRKRQVFGLKVPGGFTGSVPIKLAADMGQYHAERTVWITVN